jgi:glutathione S-transferase
MRFWFLDYYEDFDVAALSLERVRRWRDACMIHPAIRNAWPR